MSDRPPLSARGQALVVCALIVGSAVAMFGGRGEGRMPTGAPTPPSGTLDAVWVEVTGETTVESELRVSEHSSGGVHVVVPAPGAAVTAPPGPAMPASFGTIGFGVLDGIRIGAPGQAAVAALPGVAEHAVTTASGAAATCLVAPAAAPSWAGETTEVLVVDGVVLGVVRRANPGPGASGTARDVSFDTFGLDARSARDDYQMAFDDVRTEYDGPGRSQPRWIVGSPGESTMQFAHPAEEPSPITVIGVFDASHTMRDPHGVGARTPCGAIAEGQPGFAG